jgi:O-antigen biosynthesis rhamnosyltransferase
MRVLHVYKTCLLDSIGGIEQVIHQLARGAKKYGITADVFALTAQQVEATTPVDSYLVHRTRMDCQIASTGFSLSAFARFSALAKQADLVHYQFPWPFMDVLHFATRVRRPSIVTYQADIVRQKYWLKLYRPLRWCFLRAMDHIVATSPNYLASSPVLKQHQAKVSVIPLGLDRASYPPAQQSTLQSWRQRLGEKFFLFVGVIRYYKGLHILLQAAHGADYPIVIVGDGPMLGGLKRQAAQLGLRQIHFLGWLPDEDKVALLQLSYAIVFPSHLRAEAFGLSLLEGAMFAKPMISCDMGTGTTFINLAQETGLVVPPSNPAALRQAMDYLWHHAAVAQAMGRCAEKRYQQLFTAEAMVAAYVDLYRRIAAHSRQ